MAQGNADIDGRDLAVRPQDDLFGHVNGHWLDSVTIPPDLPLAGAFVTLTLEAESEVNDILQESAAAAKSGGAEPGSPSQQIGDLFASFLDEDAIERHGAAPLGTHLASIDAVSSTADLAGLLGRLGRAGIGGAFAAYVDTDDRQSDRYVVHLAQSGLGLPDESYYREDGFAETREKYVAHVCTMLGLLGHTGEEAATSADRVMALETRLASGHWDKVTNRDVLKSYNLRTLTDLISSAPDFGWSAYIDGLGASESAFAEVVVRQPSYLATVSDALGTVPLDTWKTWLRFHLVSSAAPYLSSAFVEANFDFYQRTLTGAEEVKERWKRGVALVNALIGEAVGEAYVARHFPPESKAQLEALVANLVEAYRQSIRTLDWMSVETQARALEKLDLFRTKIGYPDTWRDYSTLVIDRWDLVGNVWRARAFETDRQFGKIGKPVDQGEWLINAQTVNAYYNPGTNEICFPAAILRPPFFDADADAACNYGGIGAVIGHEIGHGFDDQGSQYDGSGNLVDWWTDADREEFAKRADKLVAQYNEFEPRALPGRKVNGALTVGENIGDLGGLTIALKAYGISLRGAESPMIGGLSGTHRAFVNWALCWRLKMREALELQMLSVDPHAPAEFRANIARNLDEFHDAFETRPGDGLWLDPADRVHIW